MMGAVLPRFHQIGGHQRLGGGMRFPQFGRVRHGGEVPDRGPDPRQQEIGALGGEDDRFEIILPAGGDPFDGGAVGCDRLLHGGDDMGRLDGGEIGQVAVGKKGIGGGHGYSWTAGPHGRGNSL